MSQAELAGVINLLEEVLLGKRREIKLSLACLLARGHLLLEDLPGMGKTTLSHALAKVLGLTYQRIQFTSDLLPGDILGGEVFNPHTQEFTLHKGPIFTEVLLADEINRTTPKSQSALLEAMEERQVTIGNHSYDLPESFFVIATQNPVSYAAGTYPLPDSQLDRFLMRISLGYPSFEAEKSILKGENRAASSALPERFSREALQAAQAAVATIHASDEIIHYILNIAQYTRTHSEFSIGLSPRGTQALLGASRAYAYLSGRDYVIPEDVKMVMPSVCTHRLRDQHRSGEEHRLVERILTDVNIL